MFQSLLGKKPAVEKALVQGAQMIKQTAQIKYAPVRTGQLVDSFADNYLTVSSIDYIMANGMRRYDFENSKYVSDTGVDNGTRYRWFHRAYEEVKGDIEKMVKEAM